MIECVSECVQKSAGLDNLNNSVYEIKIGNLDQLFL